MKIPPKPFIPQNTSSFQRGLITLKSGLTIEAADIQREADRDISRIFGAPGSVITSEICFHNIVFKRGNSNITVDMAKLSRIELGDEDATTLSLVDGKSTSGKLVTDRSNDTTTGFCGMCDKGYFFVGVKDVKSIDFEHSVNVTSKVYGLDFSPYLDWQDPNKGITVSTEQIRSRLEIIAPYTTHIRTFGCTNGLEKIGSIAHSLGLATAIGAWISNDTAANERELKNMIVLAKAGNADMLIVGSEVLLRGDLTEDRLITYINRVKNAVLGIPVTYADTYSVLLSHPAVISAVDVVMANYYPYWEGISIEDALSRVDIVYKQVVEAARGKTVIVSETGWPSGGKVVGNAVPSPDNEVKYLSDFASWAYYFEAFDESWKANYEGPQGAHWGIWDTSGRLKSNMDHIFNP